MPDASLHGNLISSISCDTIKQALLDIGGGVSNVVAINPVTRTVAGRTADPETAAAWAASRNAAGENVYFSVNAPVPDAPDSKLRKVHIGQIRALHVDIDPTGPDLAAERDRIRRLAEAAKDTACPPSAVIDSGGGYQLFWLLDAPVPATPENVQWAEAQGRALAAVFGGDATQNVDRIMRLPGTVNWPDAKKAAAGRTPALAKAVGGSRKRVTRAQLEAYAAPAYQPDGASAHDTSEQVNAIIGAINMDTVYDGPTPDLLNRLTAAAAADPKLHAIINGKPLSGADQSASAYRASLVAHLCVSGGFSPTDYAAVAYSLPHCKGRDYDAAGWARQFAREWVNIGVKHAVEHWFKPIDPPAPDSNDALFSRMMAAAAEEDSDPGRFRFLSFHDAADSAMSQSTRPLIKGLLDQQAMTVLYGESNVGKTFVALDIAYHVWAGVNYDGMRTTQGDVIYIAAEGGTGILKRVRALSIDRNPTRRDGFHILRTQVNLLDPTADLQDLTDAINGACERPALIVVDTLSRVLAGGDENSSTDMGALVRNLDAIREKTTAHVMVIHHTGKDKAKGARGHSLLRAATDTEIEVTDGFVTVTKQRDLEKSWSTGFKLRQIPLGFDADGEAVNGAVVDLCAPEDVAVAPGEDEEAGEGGEPNVRRAGSSGSKKKGAKPKAGSPVQIMSIIGTLCASSVGRKASTHDILAAVNRAAQRRIAPKTLLNKLVDLRKNGEIISLEKGFWAMDEDKLSRFDVFS